MYKNTDFGLPAHCRPSVGPRLTREDPNIPLGTKFCLGQRTFVWAHVRKTSVKPGEFYQGHDALSSRVPLSGGDNHFKSAISGWGGNKGDNVIRVWGVSGLSKPEMFNDGYLIVKSGVNPGWMYQVNVVETGGTGTTLIKLQDTLMAGINNVSTHALLYPNEYYGCSTAIAQTSRAGNKVLGMGVLSGNTSGYQLLQTKGYAAARCSGGITSGALLAVAGGSGLLAISLAIIAAKHIAYAVGGGGGAGGYVAVNLCID